uniref:WDFY family member 4 n=1 Tax=Lates calcarifer TaxID=8187 RepID=A0A4W6C776_LATCA
MFYSVLLQVLLQLCRQPTNVERLVEAQELQCLIIGLTSLWDQTSAPWRHQASRILKAVSAVATNNTVPNLLGEVAVAVFSFIRDTYPHNTALFIEFDTNNGYQVLENILKCCEEGVPKDQFQPVEELLALIASFTLLGKTELKVALCVTNPQPPNFKFDPPLTKGLAVKNLQAFHLLQASLLRSQDSLLCCQLLRTLQTIWERDPANFFLLEWTVQSMAQVAACVWRKPAPVQKLFFSLLEMVVFKLNYIPHETLRALLSVLKQIWAGTLVYLLCSRMTVHSGLLVEVLSDWGLLELLLGELRRRAKILRKAGVVSSSQIMTFCMYISVSVRDLGMVPYIKIFLDEDRYRGPTLSILEQLAEINPEEFMSTAIGALCSSTQQELGLKWDLLQSVLKVLESPNSWDAFRRAGGFSGLLSLVIDMEGALSDPPQGEVWKCLGHQQLLDLLLLALHIMALAVHLHTVNAHHFETGGFYEKLAEALLQLGCFHTESPENVMWDGEVGSCPRTAVDNQSPGKSFHQFVELAAAAETPSSPSTTLQPNLPVTLRTCIRLLSYLDQFATGTYTPQELNLGQEPEDGCDVDKEKLNGPTGHEGVFTCDHVILHPGAIRVMMTLLPAVFTPKDPQLSMEVQFSLTYHVQAMVKSERNRQIMCEGGLVSKLLVHHRSILLAPNHPLHLPITRILEKLSSQAITHSDFRSEIVDLCVPVFRRSPYVPGRQNSNADASSGSSEKKLKRTFSLLKSTTRSESSAGCAIPVHQIISLVSMTSPRTFRPHRVSSSPAFVEFDMSESGYGCLFLPSLATVKGVTADSISTGGIGGDCRGFPPTAGLSFSCWFQINRFSSACDSHPIRLLSVVRHMSRTEQQYICLSISFSAYDGCLVISTEEEAFAYLDMMEPEVSTPTPLPTSLRFRCSSMLVPGQWHHLAVVMAKDVKKSCLTSAFVNGKAVGTGKMKYIQPFPGQYVSMDPTAVIDVYGLIGTPGLWKEHAALVWRVGPSYLFEEALSPEAVGIIYTQGTAYVGNFLALHHNPDAESLPHRLVPEERISFGINPAISTLTTVAQIREDYNEVDCRLIAKEMGITSRDHSTPVFLAQNISQHLSGTARTIGAALVGHFGVRTFTPNSASNGFLYVGGPAVVLSLAAMAPDDSSLYAAVKVLLSVLETNSAMQQEMNRINGYKGMDHFFMSTHYLFGKFLIASCFIIPCFQVWQNTSDNLDLSVLNHFAEILKSSSDGRNAAVMHSIGLLPRLLFELSDTAVTFQKVKIISCVITSLLKAHFTPQDMSRLGLFLVYTLPPLTNISGPASLIWIRNQLLLALCEILNSDSFLKAVFDSLGSDWFLLFLQPHLHPSTLKLGLVLLTHFLSSPDQQSCFRDGVIPGTLIEGMAEPTAVMDNLRAHSWSHECVTTTCPGFDVLQGLLIRHSHLPEVYEALAALLLGKTNSHNQPVPPAKHMSSTDASWELQLPASVMQFLCLLHSLRPRDPLWASLEFLHALAGVVYPLDSSEVCFSPDGASLQQRQSFQTELLELMMDIIHMLSHEEENNTHLNSQGRITMHGFLIAQTGLNMSMQKILSSEWMTEKTLSALYSCTNKALLYFLSQPRHSQEEKEGVIRSLQTFMERWDVVMATYNANVNFITCLLHCLLLIRSGSYPEGFGCLPQKVQKRTASPHLFATKARHSAYDREVLVSLAEACWSKVMVERQHTLEETYKIEISATQTTETRSVSMTDISPLWEETANKTWLLHIVMVSGLRVTEGVLLFGMESLLLCEGFTLSPAGDVCCRKHHPSSVRDSFISTMLSKEPTASCRCWLYEDIKDARFMRFLLEDNAIEVFMKNGHSAFLVFLNKDHVSAYKRYHIYINWIFKTFLFFLNFEYLMHLNTIAGRTYNDLMQYPVFPWVLADYQSETLDLLNPATFRDLSKPMGAQTEKRKQMFIERYEEVENSGGEGDLSARCHYCTHYSSAIIVASFLVRIEPFSHTFQALQGGFDIPERMFYSLKKEWESASRDNMGDVRELIPEFFYLPDFLLNSNHIQLGCMENGTTLGDVELPPWAKGDPQEFIRIHREALESDHVSSHLHLWIDLIFGYRQQGPAAVESVNTFHPYFYAQRGRQNEKDPLIRSTILGYVSNFGQVPKQLFTKPHPPRSGSKKEGSSPPHPTPFFFKLDKLKTTTQPTPLLSFTTFCSWHPTLSKTVHPSAELPRGPVGQILCLEKEVLVMERNRLLLSPLSTCFFSWGFPDNSCAFGNYATEKTFAVCESLCDWGTTLCAVCPNATTIITGGTSTVVCVWDVAVNKDKLTHMKLRQPLYGHTDSVTCLAVSEVHSMIVSGSRDLTCILWDMEELSYITQLAGHTTSISALAINELSGEITSCAGPLLYLWTMKGQLLTCTDTSCGPRADILCVSFTQRHEWDTRNVIVTGCADGIIQVRFCYCNENVCPVTERDGNVTGSRIGYA